MNEARSFNSRQLLFKELFVGTLIYTIVLGFFDDYTSIVEAKSFSYIFLAAIILEVLTRAAFAVKDAIVRRLRHRGTPRAIALMVFGVWFVLFSWDKKSHMGLKWSVSIPLTHVVLLLLVGPKTT